MTRCSSARVIPIYKLAVDAIAKYFQELPVEAQPKISRDSSINVVTLFITLLLTVYIARLNGRMMQPVSDPRDGPAVAGQCRTPPGANFPSRYG